MCCISRLVCTLLFRAITLRALLFDVCFYVFTLHVFSVVACSMLLCCAFPRFVCSVCTRSIMLCVAFPRFMFSVLTRSMLLCVALSRFMSSIITFSVMPCVSALHVWRFHACGVVAFVGSHMMNHWYSTRELSHL